MTCPNCNNTKDWYPIYDGRLRCPVCFYTSETKAEKVEREQEDAELKVMLTGKAVDPEPVRSNPVKPQSKG